MKITFKAKMIIIALFPITAFINMIVKNFPSAVNKFYSDSINKFIRQVLSSITGVFPFSVAEILVITLSVVLIFLAVRTITALIRGSFMPKLVDLLSYISILYILFMLCWGFNYDRVGFDKIAHLSIRKSSEEQLYNLCNMLIKKANTLRKDVDENSQGVMYVKGGYKAIFRAAKLGYKAISGEYPQLAGYYGRPKPILLSQYMSYSGITGIYIPYTGEANVNINNTDLMLPSTVLHEMAHQRGFAPEDEANYISYIACMHHPYKYFQYSGTMMALEYSMDALYEKNRDDYAKLIRSYSPGVIRDLQHENKFWEKYNGKIQDTLNKVNNSYLKSNGQSDGVESYGRMVDLLLAQYKSNPESFK